MARHREWVLHEHHRHHHHHRRRRHSALVGIGAVSAVQLSDNQSAVPDDHDQSVCVCVCCCCWTDKRFLLLLNCPELWRPPVCDRHCSTEALGPASFPRRSSVDPSSHYHFFFFDLSLAIALVSWLSLQIKTTLPPPPPSASSAAAQLGYISTVCRLSTLPCVHRLCLTASVCLSASTSHYFSTRVARKKGKGKGKGRKRKEKTTKTVASERAPVLWSFW